MTDKELLQMALDALISQYEQPPINVPTIEALRARLAQSEYRPIEKIIAEREADSKKKAALDRARQRLKDRLAQPDPEPKRNYYLHWELRGVIIDVEQGPGFDAGCLETIKRVADALAEPDSDAYYRGYQDGTESMFAQWCYLKSEIYRLRSEVRRLKEVIEERMYG